MPLYFITYVVLFWIPLVLLGFALWGKMDKAARISFWICWAVMIALTFAMEYIYIWLDVWTFSQAVDPLLGIDLFGVPIEEFVFWWGAAPLFVLMYLGFDRLMPRKTSQRGRHAPA